MTCTFLLRMSKIRMDKMTAKLAAEDLCFRVPHNTERATPASDDMKTVTFFLPLYRRR